jgi:hypothetical protein
MAELPSVITIESDTIPAIEACEAHLLHLARIKNSTLSLALTGVVPAVCDAEAGEGRRSNLTVSEANPTDNGSSTDSQSGDVVIDQTDSLHAKPSPAEWLKRSCPVRLATSSPL